ncbi:hypothetical protein PGH12_11415 [Chryseobacterium wangxinyae]|uniref:hypothetical protein n=1 Tax=Chryseobacterium sp. CY350 TaxID=2997336 RepID=UPI00226EED84|nr:hypothetical protein [Chryseobacterium sp. CY350]MCY0976321.1 hypothetical protein [Chryseobacterium sp. CY350]WBZ94081.1 hypothetical protein PGH12_11415 [Chryseobacterium sp. CY350]
MMNTRVLELLKNPKNIQSEDLNLLKEEINSFPYVQNIRALHLYGVHLYDKENYQKALSSTAAYTTDKKILYQLINGKIQQIKPQMPEPDKANVDEKVSENSVLEIENVEENHTKAENVVRTEPKSFSDHDYEAASEGLIAEKPEIIHLVVAGERNRILFEGEENFLDEDNNETIDLESTLESGVIVTQKSLSAKNSLTNKDKDEAVFAEELAGTSSEENLSASDELPESQVEEITDNAELNLVEIVTISEVSNAAEPETPKSEVIINEDKIDSQKVEEKINNEDEISFQKVESFSGETENEEKIIRSSIESDHTKTEESKEVLNAEVIIEEEKIDSEDVSEKINNDSELSFHGTDSFLPEVKIESHKTEENTPAETPKSNVNKHEDEMRRLIEEVEKRMKERKENAPEKVDIKDEEINHDISFAETQAFHVGEEQKTAEEVIVKEAESIVEENLEEKKSESFDVEDDIVDQEIAVNSSWKPMSFEASRPDSLLNKTPEVAQSEIHEVEKKLQSEAEDILQKNELKSIPQTVENTDGSDEIEEIQAEENPEKNGEVPVMNVSFFGSDIASLGLSFKSDQKEKADARELEEKIAQQKADDSNVPGFINTWQSWLKIDRAEDVPVDKTDIKNKVIESFIENNPKISQLKDEVNFVVKEKTDDISHLMTETLANLYIEQKLYSKAVNAFLILSNKFPDKKEYFEEKIQEIKDSRNKN